MSSVMRDETTREVGQPSSDLALVSFGLRSEVYPNDSQDKRGKRPRQESDRRGGTRTHRLDAQRSDGHRLGGQHRVRLDW